MKLVRCNKLIHGKYISYNFIDENDVFLGYDLNQACCEDVGWFISDIPDQEYNWRDSPDSNPEDLEGFIFNQLPLEDSFITELDELDPGGHISVMIVHPEKGIKYLHIYNDHNGYYGHEYVLANATRIIATDTL